MGLILFPSLAQCMDAEVLRGSLHKIITDLVAAAPKGEDTWMPLEREREDLFIQCCSTPSLVHLGCPGWMLQC